MKTLHINKQTIKQTKFIARHMKILHVNIKESPKGSEYEIPDRRHGQKLNLKCDFQTCKIIFTNLTY